jgi:hypothetical protein
VKATLLVRNRIAFSDTAFAEIVVWQLARPLPGSSHTYKYRLAYVVDGECVLRFDNETGKGDHRHVANREYKYQFQSLEKLLSDFQNDIRRLNREDRNT